MSYTSAGTLVSSLPVSCHCQVGVPVGRHQPTRLPLGPGTVAGGRLAGGADEGGTDGAVPGPGDEGEDETGGLVKIAECRPDRATTSAAATAPTARTTSAATTATRTRRGLTPPRPSGAARPAAPGTGWFRRAR